MSLQVWLPLTKDLRQQGLSDMTVTNNGATYSTTGGKLGGTYTFNGSSNYLTVSKGYFGANYSYSLWFYTTSTSATQNLGCCRNSVGEGFAIFLIGGKIRIDGGGTGDATQWVTNYTFSANTWTHLTVTCANGVLKFYINGVYQGTKTITLTSSKWGTIYSVGASQASGSGYGNFLNGKINDVRIYDHCLSPMEVKELAKGLVLHYPLDRQGFGQENLVLHTYLHESDWWTGNTSGATVSNNKVTIQAAGEFYQKYSSLPTTSVPSGTTLTLSCYFYENTISTGNRRIYYACSPSWLYVTVPANFTGLFTSTFTTTAELTKLTIDYDTRNWTSGKWVCGPCKLEYGSIATPWSPNSSDTLATTMGLNSTTEYDCSGFCNNGTRTGTFTWTSDTPKYAVSQYFTDYTRYITTSLGGWTPSSITLSCWIKSTNKTPRGNWHIPLSLDGQKAEISIGTTGKARIGFTVGGTRYVYDWGNNILNGTWHLITNVFDGNSMKMYIDGVLINSSNISGALQSMNNLYVGRFNGVDTYGNTQLYESDVRIYATALSASDVKSLYQNSAYIDNSGNIYGAVHMEV